MNGKSKQCGCPEFQERRLQHKACFVPCVARIFSFLPFSLPEIPKKKQLGEIPKHLQRNSTQKQQRFLEILRMCRKFTLSTCGVRIDPVHMYRIYLRKSFDVRQCK